ncbi:hypothetical protein J3E72DRAFT_162894, partial [Bipolaris maydis]
DRSAPLSYLLPLVPGFCCPHCIKRKPINWDQTRQHAKAKHNITALACLRDQSRYKCYLQSWTKYSPKHWIVTQGNSSSQQAIPEQPYSISEEEHLLQMKDEEEEEEQCFHGESDMVALDAALEHDENTEWLRGCEWPAWFAHKPIHIIDAAAALPSARTSEDLVMSI